MHFCQSKIHKMWNYCLKLWFFRNCLLQRLETCGIGCGMPQTPNMCHSSHFYIFFPVKNQQNVKFLPEIVIFQELLNAETWNLWHWIWHASNPKYVPLKPFLCIFPSQNQQNVKFWLFPKLPLIKNWRKINLCREKVFHKGLQICTYRFLGMPLAMHYVRTLCDKYFLSYYGFSAFLWEGQDIGFWNMV